MSPKVFSTLYQVKPNFIILVIVTMLSFMTGCGNSNHNQATETPSPLSANSTTSAPTSDRVSTNVANTTVTPSDSTASVSAKAINENGEKVYQASCRVCHDTGNLGSPRMGDKAAWKERITQGNDLLYTHAIKGFTGKTGVMPPKGTSTAPDADIKAAVDYIVAKSQ